MTRLSVPSMTCLVVALFSCVTASPVWAGEKTDTLVMQNGNEITGEVKGLDQGQLTFNTDDLGILSVTWDSVAGIVSVPRAPFSTGERTGAATRCRLRSTG